MKASHRGPLAAVAVLLIGLVGLLVPSVVSGMESGNHQYTPPPCNNDHGKPDDDHGKPDNDHGKPGHGHPGSLHRAHGARPFHRPHGKPGPKPCDGDHGHGHGHGHGKPDNDNDGPHHPPAPKPTAKPKAATKARRL